MTESHVFAMRMWKNLLATQELLSVYLGVKLGLYDAMADAGTPMTPADLARAAGIDPRYAREWLEQQAVTAVVEVAGAHRDGEQRTYRLPDGHARVLRTSDDPMSMAALAVLPLGGIAAALPALLAAYRTGAGVPDDVFGDDWRDGHSGANRSLFAHDLAGWIREKLPDVHAALGEPGRRIADVACGTGWSSIALARAYPRAHVHGLDLDAAALVAAEKNAVDAGLRDRIGLEVRDAADPALAGEYDLVCLFDALHEMARPVEVLRACRQLRAPGGTVLLMDAKVAPTFTAPGDDVERFQYGTSVLHCLPAARAAADSTGTGTVLRPNMVRDLALRAGFGGVAVVNVGDRFHRMYRLLD
ncbi:methyltransferase domain-containing protein [Micromonospora sp. R77]|uniref:class I SAM-dependent methyltransferase n=1 Tax=Micromonospora sp. R77 TaxID=2925836 RepID=UPI001F6015DD|nr:class I SAM-dependent methyltransferase [Micromonospora sp. R77]MCI4066420.1 methyltransferase domain-containing protein [Micromonospora sp. R77]